MRYGALIDYGRHDLMKFCLDVLEIPNARELNGFYFFDLYVK